MIDKTKKQLANTLDLPKELLLDYPLTSFIGNEELMIQNHKGIIEYTSEVIRVKTKIGPLKIEGKHLYINKMSPETLIITGIIRLLMFME